MNPYLLGIVKQTYLLGIVKQTQLLRFGKATDKEDGKLWIQTSSIVMFWPFDPAKNAIQGDAPEGSDTF